MFEILSRELSKEKLFDELLSIVYEQGYSSEQISLLTQAYELARESHQGQIRKSGEEYITHPIKVTILLTQLQVDIHTLCAGLLHDVLEDTECAEETIKKTFGEQTLLLVQGVTKLSKIKFQSQRENQAENFRKLVLAIAEDVRVLIIKLADRMHNIHTLKHLNEEKQKRIARETVEIFAPLANRFGLNFFKWRLEDIAFKYLEPEAYKDIEKIVSENRKTREHYLGKIQKLIEDKVYLVTPNVEVTGRVKHFYSIYNKLKRLNSDEIFDLLALRVIVNKESQCYEVLGIIHDLFKPLPGRFKDYIALPKTNGYSSLHTTVIGPDKKIVEIQIRTPEMHHIAEYGIAAHWKYKESGESVKTRSQYDNSISSLKQKLLTLQNELPDVDEYNEAIKIDLFSDEIFAFSPKGDVFPLPRGATPIDFAYHVHTEIGDKCIGAKVNNRQVTLSTQLKNGDIVQIQTAKNATPSPDWINIAKSNSTRSRIKQWFKKNCRDEYIITGLARVTELVGGKAAYDELNRDNAFDKLAEVLSLKDKDDVFLRLGVGEITHSQVIGRLRNLGYFQKEQESFRAIAAANKQEKQEEAQITELKEFKHSFAKCCHPLPGEDIKGIIVKTKGIVIHKADCSNISNLPEERFMPISWDNAQTEKIFSVAIEIECMDRVGITRDIFDKIAQHKVNITDMRNFKSEQTGMSILRLNVEINSIQTLDKMLTSICSLSDVMRANRLFNN